MRTRRLIAMLLVLAGGAGVSSLARAGTTTASDRREEPFSASGIALLVGGGVNRFTDDALASGTGAAVAWSARIVLGTRRVFAVDVAYLGSIQSIETTRSEDATLLVTNGLEVASRIHLLGNATRLYAIAGLAWRLYRLIEYDGTFSAVLEDDGVFEVPLGVGVSHTLTRFLLDLRLTFRPAFDDDLARTPDPSDPAARMDSVNVELSMGWLF
jgi:hypothetical protein